MMAGSAGLGICCLKRSTTCIRPDPRKPTWCDVYSSTSAAEPCASAAIASPGQAVQIPPVRIARVACEEAIKMLQSTSALS